MALKPISPHAPLPTILRQLARAGWGELAGPENAGVRAILRGLADILPDGSAEGTATAYQVADAAGYKDRWTRACLKRLETLGVLTWRRGTIGPDGRPAPGHMRVDKARLCEIARAARTVGQSRRRDRRRETAERVSAWQGRPVDHDYVEHGNGPVRRYGDVRPVVPVDKPASQRKTAWRTATPAPAPTAARTPQPVGTVERTKPLRSANAAAILAEQAAREEAIDAAIAEEFGGDPRAWMRARFGR